MIGIRSKRKVALQGFPGIGNVSKILLDYLVKIYNPKLIKKITTYHLPNIVFVKENNMIEPASISIYQKSFENLDLIFLTGNAQPSQDYSAYYLANLIAKELKKLHVDELIAFGGIGLLVEPEKPSLFVAGTDINMINHLKEKYNLKDSYGLVTHISGLAGLIPLFSSKKGITSFIIVAETLANPFYLGIPGARSCIEFLNDYLNLNIDLTSFDKEFKFTKKKKDNIQKVQQSTKDLSYIG